MTSRYMVRSTPKIAQQSKERERESSLLLMSWLWKKEIVKFSSTSLIRGTQIGWEYLSCWQSPLGLWHWVQIPDWSIQDKSTWLAIDHHRACGSINLHLIYADNMRSLWPARANGEGSMWVDITEGYCVLETEVGLFSSSTWTRPGGCWDDTCSLEGE